MVSTAFTILPKIPEEPKFVVLSESSAARRITLALRPSNISGFDVDLHNRITPLFMANHEVVCDWSKDSNKLEPNSLQDLILNINPKRSCELKLTHPIRPEHYGTYRIKASLKEFPNETLDLEYQVELPEKIEEFQQCNTSFSGLDQDQKTTIICKYPWNMEADQVDLLTDGVTRFVEKDQIQVEYQKDKKKMIIKTNSINVWSNFTLIVRKYKFSLIWKDQINPGNVMI